MKLRIEIPFAPMDAEGTPSECVEFVRALSRLNEVPPTKTVEAKEVPANDGRPATVAVRRTQIRGLLKSNNGDGYWTRRRLAEKFRVTDTTISKDLAALKLRLRRKGSK